MHQEHAELISQLRAENLKLSIEVAEVRGLRAIVEGQDKLLESSGRIMKEQGETIERLMAELRKFIEVAP